MDVPIDSDADLLQATGQDISFLVKIVIVEMTFLGAYLVLCGLAFYTVLTRPHKTRGWWLLLSVLGLACAFIVTYCAVDIALLCTEIQVVLIDNTALSIAERLEMYNELPWLLPATYVQTIFVGGADSGLLYILNDILASWRALSIWKSRRGSLLSLSSVLYFFLFATCVIWIASAVLHWSSIKLGVIPNSDPAAFVPLMGSATSIAANLVATIMTGYTTYGHISLVSRSGVGTGTIGAKVLVLLTESGLLYAIIQIIRFALTISIVPSTPLYGSLFTATGIFQAATSIMTAMYTPVLILIIHHGYSVADRTMELTSNSSRSNRSEEGPGTLRLRPMSKIVFASGNAGEGSRDDKHGAQADAFG